MTRRMLDSAIWQNEKFASLPAMGRILSIGMINNADDQGRGKAHPAHLRSMIFPYDDISLADISEWLTLIAGNETVIVYTVDGKDYYQIINWWTYQSHQYAMPSQYPKPSGWQDRIRKTFTKGVIVTCNWITTDGRRSPDTCNEQGLAIQVNDQVNDQVNVQGEDTSISISISSRSSSNGKSHDDDDLIDPEVTKAISKWQSVFAGTPFEAVPPVDKFYGWLAFGGPEVLAHMIQQAQDKRNPAGYLYTTYDNWRKDGEVSPHIANSAGKVVEFKPRRSMTDEQLAYNDRRQVVYEYCLENNIIMPHDIEAEYAKAGVPTQ